MTSTKAAGAPSWWIHAFVAVLLTASYVYSESGAWGTASIGHNGTISVTVTNITGGWNTSGHEHEVCWTDGGGSSGGNWAPLCEMLSGLHNKTWSRLCENCTHANMTVDIVTMNNNGTCDVDYLGATFDSWTLWNNGTIGFEGGCHFGFPPVNFTIVSGNYTLYDGDDGDGDDEGDYDGDYGSDYETLGELDGFCYHGTHYNASLGKMPSFAPLGEGDPTPAPGEQPGDFELPPDFPQVDYGPFRSALLDWVNVTAPNLTDYMCRYVMS
ncbi:hypothetical protein EMCLV013L [Equine molluscum contagiosum-like virus]|nr:hypothetical protein EMCLV013L [Equine molluscum contagiosum-like virus]